MGYVFAFLAALLWGLAAIPVKLTRYPARVGIMASMVVATVVLGVLLLVSGQLGDLGEQMSKAGALEWVLIVLVGVLRFGVGVGLYFAAVQHAGVSAAAPILSLGTVLVVVGSVVFGMSEASALLLLAGVVASVGGVVLGLGLKSERTIANRRDMHKGVLYALLSCVFIAAGHLMIAKVLAEAPEIRKGLVAWFALILGCVGYLVILGFTGQLGKLARIPLREVAAFGGHGLLSFAGAYWLFLEALNILKVGRTQVITGVWPAVAAFIGVAVFREKVNWAKVVGTALMLSGAVLAVLSKQVS